VVLLVTVTEAAMKAVAAALLNENALGPKRSRAVRNGKNLCLGGGGNEDDLLSSVVAKPARAMATELCWTQEVGLGSTLPHHY
jgi:hypothetical protein